MLATLHIRDLALVEHAEVSLSEGLNVLSGETGGGKSLVVQALQLLRGERGSAGLVRHGARELRVDGEFVLGGGERSQAIRDLCRDLFGVVPEDETLLVTRTVDSRGRSRVRVCGRPGTLAGLRQLGGWLLEIHGQGESRSLMRPEIQAEILDAFGDLEEHRRKFADALAEARAAAALLRESSAGARERLERVELLRFQLERMRELDLQPGELERLTDEHRLLSNLDRLRELLERALTALQEGEVSAGDLLARAANASGEAEEIDPTLVGLSAGLRDAGELITDAARTLQSRLSALEVDPAGLEAVEDRLAALRAGLKRFGPTEADYLEEREQMQEELAELESALASPESLEEQLHEREQRVADIGAQLVRARRAVAPSFTSAIEEELAGLGMAETRITVELEDAPAADEVLELATPVGPGGLEFHVRVNPGEPPTLLRETASGGEVARIVLALKKCLADRDRVPFLVFDEVDSEIGGRLGLAVGRKLREVAASHQVLIITHLPQVAAFADTHLHVSKEARGDRTASVLRTLSATEAEAELAAMSAGDAADAGALEEARRLLARARGS